MLTSIYTAQISYEYQTSIDGLSIQPLIGYVDYYISSPDAGLANNEDEALSELYRVDSISNRSGWFTGLSLVKSMGKNWVGILRGDLRKSTTIQLGYKI